MRQAVKYTLSILLFFASANAFAQTAPLTGDPSAGEKKALVCSACHGPGGVSVNPIWPNLAGQHTEYLKKQIHDFKNGMSNPENALRTDPIMGAQAALLSEQDIADVAAYFSKQALPVGAADEKLAQRGQEIYKGGDLERNIPACSACHSPTGLGNGPAKYPQIAGQHADYLEKTLHDFKNGTRKNDAGRIMRDIAERLSDHEIKAVSSYIQGLHP